MRDLLQIDPIELEVGYALIPLIDEGQGGDLLERISLLRKQAALELGILVPPIRIRDDIRLPANEYVIKLRGSEVARAEVLPRFMMALNTGGVVAEIDGMESIDPSLRHAGALDRRLAPHRGGSAGLRGGRADHGRGHAPAGDAQGAAPPSCSAVRKCRRWWRRSRSRTRRWSRRSSRARCRSACCTACCSACCASACRFATSVTILEALGDGAETTKDPEALTEVVRRSLTNVIARLFADRRGVVRGITIGGAARSRR